MNKNERKKKTMFNRQIKYSCNIKTYFNQFWRLKEEYWINNKKK